MYSMGGDGAKGLEILREVEQMKKANAAGFERLAWEKIWFQEGSIQFWYNELDRSLENLQRVTAHADDVDLNTGVMAWLRTGQIHDMKGQRGEAVAAYRKAIAYAPQADAAQEAKRYLSSPYRRL
jgi:tetratricopeptide (TPR) repeat protein